MDTEMMIRELKRVEEKHKHDKVFTGQLDVAKMAYDTRKRLEELKPYEDTGLTPEQIMELKEAVQKLENIFGDEITINQVIDFFVDFYIAQGDTARVEDAVLLINEEAAKWRELKERDTAKVPTKVSDSGVRYTDDYICPNCGKHFIGTGIAEFCYHCGQRLKWEEL